MTSNVKRCKATLQKHRQNMNRQNNKIITGKIRTDKIRTQVHNFEITQVCFYIFVDIISSTYCIVIVLLTILRLLTPIL